MAKIYDSEEAYIRTKTAIETLKTLFGAFVFAVAVCMCLFLSNKAFAKSGNEADSFCFEIATISLDKNNFKVLGVEKKKIECLAENKPPKLTKAICAKEDWYPVALGVLECFSEKNKKGYRLKRVYGIKNA